MDARTLEHARRVDTAIDRWLKKTGRDEAKPKDVMDMLIDERIFSSDNKAGQPLRRLLRSLDEAGHLNVMRTVRVEGGPKNRQWYFRRAP